VTVIIELFAGGLRLARTSKEYTKAVNYVNTKNGGDRLPADLARRDHGRGIRRDLSLGG